MEILKNNRVEVNDTNLIQGFYKDSLIPSTRKQLPIRSAAIVMIDCDLYESTKHALDFITDYIVSGTVIIFEDWFCFRNDLNKGEQKAFREWLESNPQFHASDFGLFPTLKSFVMYRAEA